MFNLAAIGAGLPVVACLPALIDAPQAVIQAPPGTGKTTLIPPAVCNKYGGRVVVVAPRRVAVRAAAARLSSLSGLPIGYAIRGSSQPSDLVEFVTPGVLLRHLLKDPFLEGVSAVIVDEVHERGLDTDLVLGMLIELASVQDLPLYAMSATVDAARFSELLDAPIISTPAVTHPIDIRYQPIPGRLTGDRAFYQSVARLAASALGEHSVLVFVPGAREVSWVCEEIDAYPLHGRLSLAEQDAALYTSRPRIIVATNVAESSVTVPGVRTVIDTGLAREPRLDRSRGLTGLITVSTSKSSADQRAGRAGREGPGTVIRTYSQAEYQAFQPFGTPEILTSDLTQALLFMRCWGSTELPLLDQPPATSLAHAAATLDRLDSPLEDLAALPLEPRLGHALLRTGDARTVAELADAPTGLIGTTQPPAREIRRLSSLAPSQPPKTGLTTAFAYPEWVARRVSPGEYLLASGTRAQLGFPGLDAEWIACAVVSRTKTGGVIRAAAPLTEAEALSVLPPVEEISASVVDGKVQGRRIRRAGAIELSATPISLSAAERAEALTNAVRQQGIGILQLSERFCELRDRLAFLHAQLGGPWPDVSDDALAATWSGDSIQVVADFLRGLLPWPEAAQLDELAPAHLKVPSGRKHRLEYDSGRPVCRVKLQECFGLKESPVFAGVKVQFHLLSPAGRPLAVTDDLASFWEGPYQGVRKDMRGRYPKHPWPEDPWTALATARTKNAPTK